MNIIDQVKMVAPKAIAVFYDWCIENKRIITFATIFDYQQGVISRYLCERTIVIGITPIILGDNVAWRCHIIMMTTKEEWMIGDFNTREDAMCGAFIKAFTLLEATL
jgi:hypothetical protein